MISFVELWELKMVNSDTKISVIISISNNSKHLRKCLDTLRFQTYENLEFICITTSPTQEIWEVLEDYKNTDKRFRVVNLDADASFLTKVQKASGEYISFVNSNHWVLLNLYEVFIDALKAIKRDIDIYMFNCATYIDGENDVLPLTALTLNDWNNHSSNLSIHTCKDCKRPFTSSLFIENKIFRKDFILKLGEPFGKNLRFTNEFASLKYLLNAESIVLNDAILYRYRLNDDRIASENIFDIFEVIDCIDAEIKRTGMYEMYKYALFQFKYNTYYQYYKFCPDELRQKYFSLMQSKLDYKLYSDLDFNICKRLNGFNLYLFIVNSTFNDFNKRIS